MFGSVLVYINYKLDTFKGFQRSVIFITKTLWTVIQKIEYFSQEKSKR